MRTGDDTHVRGERAARGMAVRTRAAVPKGANRGAVSTCLATRHRMRRVAERPRRCQHRALVAQASALRNAFAEIGRHAAKRALVNLAFISARKRHAKMLKLINSFRRIAAQIFNRILVAQPVRAFDRVIHMPAPVIIAHITERGGNAALRRNRMRACREDFRNTCRLQATFSAA